MEPLALWQRYQEYLCECPSLGLSLDVSRVGLKSDFVGEREGAIQKAFDAMVALEAGGIANPDEKRMVGHYWLRAPQLAPSPAIAGEIEETLRRIQRFAADVHEKRIVPPTASRYTDVLVIGIGGSALGPQLVADSLGTHRDALGLTFLDNTDPDGFERAFHALSSRLKSVLVLVMSKSGTTPETRNGMLEARAHFQARGLDFPRQAVAVTQFDRDKSALYRLATDEKWLDTFPMWDWVGGRTSVTSAVGLLPAALQGLDIQGFLEGAAEMDRLTRNRVTRKNPAALLALAWHAATGGHGLKDMVILPYKDRLLLLARYLQQLIMESLGKEKDLQGKVVHQGISVYGNKGSTDQHAYVQQLRDGVNNALVNFIVVLRDAAGSVPRHLAPVDAARPEVFSGDYLSGFWQGTRQALAAIDRESLTITVERLDARALGALVALYERAVGLYATLVNVNAYHQPGVEAGKKAAEAVLNLQVRAVAHLRQQSEALAVEAVGEAIEHQLDAEIKALSERLEAAPTGNPEHARLRQDLAERKAMKDMGVTETILHVFEHLEANKRGVVSARGKYRWKAPAGSSPTA